MGAERSGKLTLIKKGRDLIIKFNPYHGYHGYFSSRDAHTDFSPGSGNNRARAIVNENIRRISEGNTELVSGDYSITLKSGKATYAEARRKMAKVNHLDILKEAGLTDDECKEFLNKINTCGNHDIAYVYKQYGDIIPSVKEEASGGYYNSSKNELVFSLQHHDLYPEMEKFGTLAHEYGHYFDHKVSYEGLHFSEADKMHEALGFSSYFNHRATLSDEFLQAVRKDKSNMEKIGVINNTKVRDNLKKDNLSSGVQDAVDGLFPKSRLAWGHGEKYYNSDYDNVAKYDRILGNGGASKAAIKRAFQGMGFEANNETQVREIFRQYRAAKEIWANVVSAETCGNEKELAYIKKYLPNSYEAMKNILDKAK